MKDVAATSKRAPPVYTITQSTSLTSRHFAQCVQQNRHQHVQDLQKTWGIHQIWSIMYRSELETCKSGIASYWSEDIKPRTLISWHCKQNPQTNQQNRDWRRGRAQVAYTVEAPEDWEKSADGGRLGRATEVEGELEGSSYQSYGERRGEKWGR